MRFAWANSCASTSCSTIFCWAALSSRYAWFSLLFFSWRSRIVALSELRSRRLKLRSNCKLACGNCSSSDSSAGYCGNLFTCEHTKEGGLDPSAVTGDHHALAVALIDAPVFPLFGIASDQVQAEAAHGRFG